MKSKGKLLATLAALGMGCLTAECWVRVTDQGVTPRPGLHGQILRESPDRELAFEHVPGACLTVDYRGRLDEVGVSVEHTINALGWRGPEFGTPKPPHVLRIACVGDSHTFGFGVGESDTWPARLHQLLFASTGARAVEVYNFGVGGFGTEQEVRLLSTRVFACRPDLVVLQTYMNDAERSNEGPIPTVADLGLAPKVDARDHGAWAWMRSHSRLADRLIGSRVQAGLTRQYVASRALRFEPRHVERRRLEAALHRARFLCAERGVPLVVIYYPLLVPDGPRLMAHGIGDAWGEICAQERVPFLDLESTFLGRDLDRLRVHPLDYHVTGEAHALAAGSIARFLLEGGFVPPKRL